MSQQQLTESQLPITHEVLIETETNFRNALIANKSTTETKQIQIIKIIPPFSRENVKSAENLAQAYRSCASDILKQFPTTMQQKMTISKTITATKDDRKLHTLTVIAPPEAEQFITSIKSEGIILLKRTVVTFDQNGQNAVSAEFGILAASLPNWRFGADRDVV